MAVLYLIFSFSVTFVFILGLSILNLSFLHLSIPLVWLWWMIQNSILYIIQPYLVHKAVFLCDIILYGYQFALLKKHKIPKHLLLLYIIILTIPFKYEKSTAEMGVAMIFFIAHLALFPSIPASFCCLFSSSYLLYYITLSYLYFHRIKELMKPDVVDIEAQPKQIKWNFVMMD